MGSLPAPYSPPTDAQNSAHAFLDSGVVAAPARTEETSAALLQQDVFSARILVIDDEPVITKTVRKHLLTSGYTNVLTTNSSVDGCALIERDPPDLVLTDISMPELTGLDLLERIRQNDALKLTPVIIFTASQSPEIKHKALRLGATDFLAKPVDSSELSLRVHNTLVVKAHSDHLTTYAKDLQCAIDDATRELTQTRLEVIHCLARAAEYRDTETGRHIIRVSRYVGVIAREYGIPEETAALMEQASLLHDVGKIGISDDILLKKGKLTPEEVELIQSHCEIGKGVFERVSDEEWDVVKRHTDIGASILGSLLGTKQSPLLAMAARIALTHHERWDGSGYPLALAGESIPIEGRITAVADVFDALSSKRPYKPPFSLEKCFSILKDGYQTQFDGKVLDAFFSRKSEIVAIQIEHSDIG